MQYGLQSCGPSSPRGLLGWVVVDSPVEASVDVVLTSNDSGSDGRSRLALGAMRSVVDAATALVGSKYDTTLATIHDALEKQQLRERLLEEVRVAVRGVSAAGVAFADESWPIVLERLKAAHPLNPRINDVQGALSHVGGIQLQMTSHKRRRVAGDAGDAGDDGQDGESNAMTDACVTRMHERSESAMLAHFHDTVALIAGCLSQPESSMAVYTDHPECTRFLIQGTPGDNGACVQGAAGSVYLTDPESGTHHWLSASNELTDINEQGQPTRPSREKGSLAKMDGWHPSACMHRLVQPALAAAALQSSVYARSVERVADMMTHINGFSLGHVGATRFAAKCREASVEELKKEVLKTGGNPDAPIIVLFRDDNAAAMHDMVLDFDVPNAWVIGLTPTLTTDAAEALQVLLRDLPAVPS